jgi:hypothetical protein
LPWKPGSSATLPFSRKMSASASPWKLGSIQLLRDVGVLEVAGEANRKGKAMPLPAATVRAKAKREDKAMPPPAAKVDAKAEKTKAMPPPAAKAGAKTEGKAKANAKGVKKGKCQEVPEAEKRWVHIHWPLWPLHGTAFFVHRDSTVGELMPKIAKWYGLKASESGICLDKHGRRLAKNTQWKDHGEWDIEVTFVMTGTVYTVENGTVRDGMVFQ